ncbi:alanine racemase [Streptomyces apocyni]|uniref:alanine racemase n=1 Tax=Streptomyces apocyni TaxID=2654677 RepID=UPI0018D092E7|nr:alanine racemase [Streptomyces apocyni]
MNGAGEARVHADTTQIAANIAAFHARSAAPVRAHVKGHRTLEIARMQRAAGSCGIAVTRPAVARHYVSDGFTDLVAAWPWRDPQILEQFAELAADCTLSVHLDDVAAVDSLDAAARRYGTRAAVRVQIDGGIDVARIAWAVDRARNLTLEGIVGYLDIETTEQATHRQELALALAASMVETADRLRAAGHPCRTVALGGTPCVDAVVPGITELGAGAYPLGDAGLVALGVLTDNDIAVRIEPGGEPLMAECGQPWHPDPWVRRLDGALVPTHICPLLLNVSELHTDAGERWPVVAPVTA